MSAPETFDLFVLVPVRTSASLIGSECVEIESATGNPEAPIPMYGMKRSLTESQKRQLRYDWLAAKKELDADIESERQASAAETRAHFRREP